MKKNIKAGLLLILLLTVPFAAQADDEAIPRAGIDQVNLSRALADLDKAGKGKTLSPFFFVGHGDSGLDELPLKSAKAVVHISGVMAEVIITQVYRNEGGETLEAIYIFPASTRAAVHAVRMTIGDRIIQAEIMERKKARETYEKAKEEGKTSTLLEQQRPNVFQMNLANILPGDLITVELKYTELIVPEEKIYRFVYPAVVGPRYSNAPAGGSDDKQNWVENPYLHQGQGTPYEFGLSVDLRTGPPLAMITSPSHEIKVEYSKKTEAHVRINEEPQVGTKDFVLEYRLAGNRIETGLLLYPGEKENYFLLMVDPPEKISPQEILPREYVFVVDISGSMRGFPLEVSQDLMTRIINGLGPDEYMNILLFAGGSSVLSANGSLPASKENKAKALAWIKEAKGGGGTELLPALKKAMDLPKRKGLSRIMVVITDGYVHVEPEAIELVRSNLGQANLFTFGIGTSVNRYLIEVLARVGQGEPQIVLNRHEAKSKAERFRRYIKSPVLTDIKVDFGEFQISEQEPVSLPDLFGERPVILFGKYSGAPRGLITLKGNTAEGEFKREIRVTPEMLSSQNTALKYLWARSRITTLSDMNNLHSSDKRVQEVTALGLKYGLLTAYTSFVAVDRLKRSDGRVVTIKQPLPLPQGVSDSAVGHGRRMLKAHVATSPQPSGSTLYESSKVPSPDSAAENAMERPQLPEVRFLIKELKKGLDQQKILEALLKKHSLFNQCYRQARMHFRDLSGQMVVIFKVDPKGMPHEIRFVSSLVKDSGFIRCLIRSLEAVTFPNSASGLGEIRLVLDLVE